MGHAYLAPQQQPNANAPRVFVEFKLHPKRNAEKSLQEGREVFDDVEYIRIAVPGDRDEVLRPVLQRDRDTYPEQYAAFKAKTSQDAVSGTPLSMVPFLTASQVLELASFNCRTVEQLAAMPDALAQKFMAIQELKRKAQDFLAAAAGLAPLEQARAEAANLRNELDVAKRQLAELSAKVNGTGKHKG